MGAIPAGWHPDPDGGRGYRWWDGATWTEDRTWPEPPPPPRQAGRRFWVWLAVFFAVLIAVGLWFGQRSGGCAADDKLFPVGASECAERTNQP